MSPSPRRFTAAVAALTLASAGVVAFAAPAAAASGDLFISEYVEGSSNNKAIEIYNPSTAAVDLAASGYALKQYSNGSPSAGLTIPLTGSVAPGDVYVLAHGAADGTILAVADQVTGTTTGLYNGDDAVALVKADVIVDVIGQIGVDPGTEWGTGLTTTPLTSTSCPGIGVAAPEPWTNPMVAGVAAQSATGSGSGSGSDPYEPRPSKVSLA